MFFLWIAMSLFFYTCTVLMFIKGNGPLYFTFLILGLISTVFLYKHYRKKVPSKYDEKVDEEDDNQKKENRDGSGGEVVAEIGGAVAEGGIRGAGRLLHGLDCDCSPDCSF